IDVGFAHLELDDGSAIDFVDVPGHDRLVGNMLVGAGEIDGVLLVVAADDGPRAQTLEHLELLDALGLRRAVVAITKSDVAGEDRVTEVAAALRTLVDRTTLVGAPIVPLSSLTGLGLDGLRLELVALRDALLADAAGRHGGPLSLAIDRTFAMRGRGAVVTGTLRGGPVRAGDVLRLEPGGPAEVRVREVQVHHGRAEVADGGRTALNLASIEAADLRRGQVLTAGTGVQATDRLLVTLRRPTSLGGVDARTAWPPSHSAILRLHHWTDAVDASVRTAGSDVAILRLAKPIATAIGARAVLRDPGTGRVAAGLTVLDPDPPRGVSRRRLTPARLAALATAAGGDEPAATTAALADLHGARREGATLVLAPDVHDALVATATEVVGAERPAPEVRAALLRELRRRATIARAAMPAAGAAIDDLLDEVVAAGNLAREGHRFRDPSRNAEAADHLAGAMAKLEASLDVNVPPSLAEAARAAGCSPEGLQALEASGRIVRVEDDLAWSAARYATLRDLALELARRGPLQPATFRDAIGGNRRIALALLEDLGRRGLLRRTEAGHVLGPRASVAR
ncbi:MAG TPA: SelB C-terminal domain-containing protein, partial [Candidatus Acidoferrales bacterium]|nr:SelB C-terminal domain-containing protein [Candidatus Acidoferrales bacterium]